MKAVFRSGTCIDDAVNAAAERNWGGLECFAGLPGSIGGAVWMNARCYGKSISDVLISTQIIDENYELQDIPFNPDDFSYKKSPFQRRDVFILSACLSLKEEKRDLLEAEMAKYRQDRVEKGHFRLPSAGSVFKNDYDYGIPSGKIIDELGLRGYTLGGAAVSSWHGNIFVNNGFASAADIRNLVTIVADKVREGRGIQLEPEILFLGEWD